MKKADKIQVSIGAISYYGIKQVQVSFPDGKIERFEAGDYLLSKAFSINKAIDKKAADGDYDYYLTPAEFDKWMGIIDKN